MFYREARRLPTSYSSWLRIIANPEDRALAAIAIALAVIALPQMASTYVLSSLLIPFLILSISATGLNSADGLCRASFAWLRRFHGRGCVREL